MYSSLPQIMSTGSLCRWSSPTNAVNVHTSVAPVHKLSCISLHNVKPQILLIMMLYQSWMVLAALVVQGKPCEGEGRESMPRWTASLCRRAALWMTSLLLCLVRIFEWAADHLHQQSYHGLSGPTAHFIHAQSHYDLTAKSLIYCRDMFDMSHAVQEVRVGKLLRAGMPDQPQALQLA